MPRLAHRPAAAGLKSVLLVVVPAIVVALLVGRVVSGLVGDRDRDQAVREATVVASALGEHRLAAEGADRHSSAATRRAVTADLRRVSGGPLTVVRVLSLQGRVAFSSADGERGGSVNSPELARAVGGVGVAAKADRGKRDAIDAFVPLRSRAGGTPRAVLQVEQPARAGSGVWGDMRRLTIALAAVLALLGVLVLRALGGGAGGSRRGGSPNEAQLMRDSLTGLPNRELYHRLVDRALADCPPDGQVGVLLLDLDRFKEINDSLGHFNGDLVIERVGKRLSTALREGDVVARLGGDEFAMLLPTAANRESVAGAARRVHEALEEPFTVGGLALRVEASIGAAMYPTDGDKAPKLLQAADVAMYAAKKAHTGHEFYAPEQHQYTPARLGLVAQLGRAMEGHELMLHYQPKARLATGTVEGVEALARWEHPQRGLLFPDEFIPVTEHTSMIRPVTVHLLETALTQVGQWSGRGLNLNVAVNLSAQLLLDLQLPREIGAMLRRLGCPGGMLELEITESAIMSDPRRAQHVLDQLREMGVRIAIDDFGTGYSSLVSLKQLPVTTIKIDKSFVMNMHDDSDDAAIVRSTVALGQNLGLEVVAEGIETAESWKQLAAMGADYAQGYYLSRPLAPAQFDRWLTAYQEMFSPRAAGRDPEPGGEASEQSWAPSTSSRPPVSAGSAPAKSGS